MATIADMQAYNMLQRIGPMNEGLAMGGEEEGGRSPYEPYKPAPTGPFVPAPGKGKDKELAMDMKDAVPRGGFWGMKRTNVIVNDGGEAYIIEPNGNFKFDGFYDPVRHGPMFPGYVQNQSNNDVRIAHAGPGQYYTEEGEVTDVSPYTFNRNTTKLEVPWLKKQYYQDLPRRKKEHNKLNHDLKIRK